MLEILDFICVKNLKTELLLKTLLHDLSSKNNLPGDLYVSILPAVEGFSFIEFADFLPVTRYRDICAKDYLKPIQRTFNSVFYLFKDTRLKHETYQKFLRATQEREYKGEGAIEKGFKFDMIMDKDLLYNHIQKIWSRDCVDMKIKPLVFQLVKDKALLEEPLMVSYLDFYGNEN